MLTTFRSVSSSSSSASPMRRAAMLAALAGLLVVGQLEVLSGQKPILPQHRVQLERMVDRVVAGEQPGGDAWLKWEAHFLKGADGKTYVPFTLTLADIPRDAFERLAMYIRVVPQTTSDEQREARVDVPLTTRPGEMPVSVPERNFVPPGTPTAGEASAILNSIASDLRRGRERFPYEAAYSVNTEHWLAAEGARRLSRALVLPSGRFTLYLAVLEQGGGSGSARAAVLRREVVVPDFTPSAFTASSLILADRLEQLDRPVDEKQRLELPYALGATQIVAATDTQLTRDEVLTVVFVLYNATRGDDRKPDVTVEYRVFALTTTGAVLRGATPPQEFSTATLPPEFDVNEHQLAPTQALPLSAFEPGTYRLEVEALDNLSGHRVGRALVFTVTDSE